MSVPPRIGIGCMRLSTDDDRDEDRALATLRVAIEGGAAVLDTAHAYGRDDAEAGHNERLVARAVRAARERGPVGVRVVTKCGMRRGDAGAPLGGYRPEGRAASIAEDAKASVEAFGGVPIDVLLLHAPDPRVPLATSVRALARAMDRGLTRSIGLSNVSRAELLEALAVAPITTVEIALGAFDDDAARGGLVRLCAERGIEVLAYSVFGGPKRAARVGRDGVIAAIARELQASPHELLLAYLRALHPNVAPIVGARRPETAASALASTRLELDPKVLERLDGRFPGLAVLRRPPPRPPAVATAEVVVLMGITGAGKSYAARDWQARGYERLNRDEMGGTLAAVAKKLETRLASGATKLVLDNTYITRAQRNDVLVAATKHGAKVVCHHVDTSVHEAQINVVLRMLERHGALLGPAAIAAAVKHDPGLVTPAVQLRMVRELEPPSLDEGFAQVIVDPFVRAGRGGPEGAMVALERVADGEATELRADAERLLAGLPAGIPCLVFAWRPGATDAWRARATDLTAELARRTGREVELGVCDHPAGAPVCWCRPPLPGLWLAFAVRRGLDPSRGVLAGASPTHATMAGSLGLRAL